MAHKTFSANQQYQLRDYAVALKRDCPVCSAKAGEPCLPMSLTIPHLARVRGERRNGAA